MPPNQIDIKGKLAQKFGNVSELSSGVFRSVRSKDGNPFAAYVFDSSRRAWDGSIDLDEYLDEIVGQSYFDESSPADLRWNNYLYFVVADEDFEKPTFLEKRRTLEENRNYARKFVVSVGRFDQVVQSLDTVVEDREGATPLVDIVQIWTAKLNESGLSEVADHDRPIADVVRGIATGKSRNTLRVVRRSGEGDAATLAREWITQIDASGFRSFPSRGEFTELGRANLLFGANGAGKTSLLEAIEFLYCGANRRSKYSGHQKVSATFANGAMVSASVSQALSDFRTRYEVWFGTRDASSRNSLPNQFGRFNFLNTDAAAELSLRSDATTSNFDSLSALLSGGDATNLWRRIQSIRKVANESLNDANGEVERLRADLKIKDSQIEAMRLLPGEADVELSVLNSHLATIGWSSGSVFSISDVRQLEAILTDAAARLGALNQLHWLSKITVKEIESQSQLLTQKSNEVGKLRQALHSAHRRIKEIEKRVSYLARCKTDLTLVPADEVANLLMLTQAQESLNRRIRLDSSIAEAVGDFPEDADLSYFDVQQISVSVLRNELSSEAAGVTTKAIRVQNELTAVEQSRSREQALLAQLKELTKRVLEHTLHGNICPVCHTDFTTVDGLRLRMEEEWSNAGSGAASLRLRAELEELTQLGITLSRRVNILNGLERICEIVNKSPTVVPPREALQTYAAARLSVQRLKAEYRDVELKIRSSEAAGIKLSTVEALCNIGPEAIDDSAKYDVRASAARIEKELFKCAEARLNAEAEIQQVQETLERNLPKLDSGRIRTPMAQLKPFELARKLPGELSRLCRGLKVIFRSQIERT